MFFVYSVTMNQERAMGRRGGYFKNAKLGKNVYRQIKRRGAPENPPPQRRPQKPQK